MSLLLDENLSPRLIPCLTSLFPGLTGPLYGGLSLIHVRDVDLRQADDRTIWDSAAQYSYTVVTADSDFVAMVSQTGQPPKLVYIERCDFPFRAIEELLPECDSDLRVREGPQLRFARSSSSSVEARP